ncbi:Protein ZBED8 [Chionoecetes opilio]|uniref:Protein ZBED8 n=1 Tax=Chionoecetes opilio TaxID=41210 RepID=A0A8J4YPV8_CHIOP|nr:Protein ZBED8 [Chionoecetes opilio]
MGGWQPGSSRRRHRLCRLAGVFGGTVRGAASGGAQLEGQLGACHGLEQSEDQQETARAKGGPLWLKVAPPRPKFKLRSLGTNPRQHLPGHKRPSRAKPDPEKEGRPVPYGGIHPPPQGRGVCGVLRRPADEGNRVLLLYPSVRRHKVVLERYPVDFPLDAVKAQPHVVSATRLRGWDNTATRQVMIVHEGQPPAKLTLRSWGTYTLRPYRSEPMASTSKKRKWNETYQQYGFTKFSRDGLDAAQCIHCSTVLANCSLKPAKLSHHQSNLHPNIELTEEDLEAKRKRFDKQGTLPTYGFQPESKPMVQASFEVALKIAERKKAHTIGEELIKPCAEIMVRNVLGDKAKREISKISLSNNTVRRRIDDMAADVCNQVCQEIRASAFRASLQLDESTDIANQSQLIAFVRYEKEEGEGGVPFLRAPDYHNDGGGGQEAC